MGLYDERQDQVEKREAFQLPSQLLILASTTLVEIHQPISLPISTSSVGKHQIKQALCSLLLYVIFFEYAINFLIKGHFFAYLYTTT